jgi:hypothetical protein
MKRFGREKIWRKKKFFHQLLATRVPVETAKKMHFFLPSCLSFFEHENGLETSSVVAVVFYFFFFLSTEALSNNRTWSGNPLETRRPTLPARP